MITFHHNAKLIKPGKAIALHRWLLIVLLLMCGFIGSVQAETSGPLAQVRTTVEAILAEMRKPVSDSVAKHNKIIRLITERFDFKLMAQRTLATNWKRTTIEERKRFVELFTRLLQATYLGRIEAYTDEKLEYKDEKIRRMQALVKTVIIGGNTKIPVNYKLRKGKANDSWKVYDVIIEKVSLIATYRSDYREVVNRNGIAGLLTKIEQKVHSLEQEK